MYKNYTNIKTNQLESETCAEYLLLETGNRAAIVIRNNKLDAMFITQTSSEDKVILETIHEKI